MTAPQHPSHAAGGVYRTDIDGLRAAAVLPVVLFHGGIAPFSGGFAGVDVFFVISGYLITRIILGDLAAGRFSVASFYERRIRRIFPALILTIVLILFGGLVFFPASELERLFDTLKWLSFFASNFYFAENSGYFDGGAETNPALHTWSLAIEEQFYLVFPLLLAGLMRLSRARAKWVLLGIAVLSFAFGIFAVDRDARPAFFSTPARIWELMLGALVAMGLFPAAARATALMRNIASGAGLAALGASFVLLSADTPFPGFYALPACAGAAAIIWAGEGGKTAASRLLSWRPLVFVGLISYSLYLLHWPLLVFARYAMEGELPLAMTWALLALSGAAAWASWRFIESPARNRHATPLKRLPLFGGAFALMLALAVTGGIGAERQRGQYTEAETFVQAEMARMKSDPCFLQLEQPFTDWPVETCAGSGEGSIAVWGDSFAAEHFPVIKERADAAGRPVILLASTGCPPILDLDVPNRPNCAGFNTGAFNLLLARKPGAVILSANWLLYEKKKTFSEIFADKLSLFSRTIDRLRGAGIKIYVIGPTPMFPVDAARLAALDPEFTGPERAKASISRKYDRYFRSLEAEGKIGYFPAFRIFCGEDTLCRFREGRDLLFWDTGHLTLRGSALVLSAFTEAFPAAGLSPPPAPLPPTP